MSLFHYNAIFRLSFFFLPLFLLTFLHCIFLIHLIFLCVSFFIIPNSPIFYFSCVFFNKAKIIFLLSFFTNVFLSFFTHHRYLLVTFLPFFLPLQFCLSFCVIPPFSLLCTCSPFLQATKAVIAPYQAVANER